MNEIAKFLAISGTHFVFIIFTIIHIKATRVNKTNGRTDSKNSLKIEFDSNGPLTSVSVIKQSKDKNVCFGSPTLTTGFRD